ncbi:MAG: two-component system response regulator OmpR [Gammaproteobacteria bacterium]|nr:two-component system response regulator OmpR [Gammaproteobacteria bacterium]
MRRILVVDDDARLRELLTRYLTEQGFAVDALADGSGMDKALSRRLYDIIILDIMLPGEDGLSLCRRLRASGRALPVLMLTAKGDEADRISGLELGADDYLGKPFNPRELVARVNAILRRQGNPPTNQIAFGPFVLDIQARRLTLDGKQIDITTADFELLRVFATHPHQPLSRDTLMQLARGRDYLPFDRSIDVRISRLRRVLEHDPAHPQWIQTLWGSGYVFTPPPG